MTRALAILLLPLAVACTRSEGAAAPATETTARAATDAAAPEPAELKRLTLLVTGDVGGKVAPCG